MRASTSHRYRIIACRRCSAARLVLPAPEQLGGSTLYTATVGDSMEPLFHKGDLAVFRRASSYRVGDIVLYQSPVLHRPVLHRILVIQDGHYYFKGDNNDFVDPGYATCRPSSARLAPDPERGRRAQLVLGSGACSVARRTGRQHSCSSAAEPASRAGNDDGAGRHTGRRAPVKATCAVHSIAPGRRSRTSSPRPRSCWPLVCLIVGFTKPVQKPVPVTGYAHTGEFSLQRQGHASRRRHTRRAAPARGNRCSSTNFRLVVLEFAYRFAPGSPTRPRDGRARRRSSPRIRRSREHLRPREGEAVRRRPHDGRRQVRHPAAADADRPVLDRHGHGRFVVRRRARARDPHRRDGRGEHIKTSFSPTLPFTIDQAVLKLNIAAPATAPGATYTGPSESQTSRPA